MATATAVASFVLHWLTLALLAGVLFGYLAQQWRGMRRTARWQTEVEAALNSVSAGNFSHQSNNAASIPGQLLRSFAAMTASLRQRTSRMELLSTQVDDMSQYLAGHCLQEQDLAEQEAQTLSASVTQLTDSVESVASSSAQAAQASVHASQGAEEGKVAMTEALGSMDRLSGELGNARRAMADLDGHIETIGGVLDVIRGIAEQTNMLALNAAIEAARAGEQGRGFAVVAEEVRNLAGRTQQSTQQIHSMIERVQNGARQVVGVVVEGDNQAKICEQLIETACIALAGISGEIVAIKDLNTHIDGLTSEQHLVVTRLGRHLLDAAGERRDRLGQNGLSDLAQRLRELSKELAGETAAA
jgi:methyl-accepting chemotaxis protein